MATIGAYEILEELYATEHGSVSRARRRDGSGADVAIKQFHVVVDDSSEPQWGLHTFLDRARLGQSLAGSGARQWIAIHTLGLDDDTAWYAADFAPLTARQLVESPIAIRNDALHSIILGATQGLTQLYALRNRPHGNLKPGNVLLASTSITPECVKLADLASNSSALRVGEAGDLRSLGELIHELVAHAPPPATDWPIAMSAAWQKVGSRGAEWLSLCNDLLHPDPALRPGLPAIAQRLQLLRSRGTLRLKRIVATAAGIAIAAGLAIGTLSVLDHLARTRFCQARRQWLGKFLDATADPARRHRWQADADLKRLLDETASDELRALDCDTARLIRWRYDDYLKLLEANRAVQTIAGEIPAHFGRAIRARDLLSRCHDRGWDQPSAYLGKLLDDITPGPSADVAGGVDRLLAATPMVDRALAMKAPDWDHFLDNLKTIDGVHDTTLTNLGAALKKSAVARITFSPAGIAGEAQLISDAAVADRLADAAVNILPVKVDRKTFDEDVVKTIDVLHPTRSDAEKWLALLDDNTYRRQASLDAGDALRKKLAEMLNLIDHAHVGADEAPSYDLAARKVKTDIADFELTPFTRRTLASGALIHRQQEIEKNIAALKVFYHPEGPEQYIQTLAPLATSSPRINQRWEAWRQVLREDLPEMDKDQKVFAARKQASDLLRSVLLALDQSFSPCPPMPTAAFAAAVADKREEAIGKLLPAIDLQNPQLDNDAIKIQEKAFEQWATNLAAISRDFPITREILGPDDRPDLRWKKQHPEFWSDPVVQDLVKDDVGRLDRLSALDHAARSELQQHLNGGGSVEVALQAWRMLGGPGISPAWPGTPEELATEARFRQRLAASFKALKDPREAQGPSAELSEQAPVRWRKFVESASSEAMIADAWNLAPVLHIDEAETAKLSPRARFDFYLYRIHQAIAAHDDGQARDGARGLSQAAGEITGHPDIAKLAPRLRRLARPQPFADKNPGDIFELALPGVAKPVQFTRIEPANGRSFYLATTDVSVGQFAAVMEATSAWPQAKKLPWPCEPGKPDTRRGPRTWEWSGTSIAPPLLWLTPEEYNDYPPALRAGRFNRMALADTAGGDPTVDHPMQYLSAQAALFYAAACGCRLPTAAEWQAAYDASEKNVSIDHWNLRDQTWEMQRRYVADGAGSRWPDEGIFPAGVTASAVGRTATSRGDRDGVLFFVPVGSAAGMVFHHLVGNVAQYVCEAPDEFEDWPDKNAADGIRKFAAAQGKSVAVIGGSALSPPESPVDKPLAVGRTDQAWADVGLRLAFTAPARSFAERLGREVGDLPFLAPDPVSRADGGK